MLRGYRHIGINDVGDIVDPLGSPTDFSYGNTTQDGVEVAFTTETTDLLSGQAKMLEDRAVVQSSVQLRFGLVTFVAEIVNRMLGQADAQATGDLTDVSNPTAEVVTIGEGTLGEQERTYYFTAPGPYGPIRGVAARGRVVEMPNLNFASNTHMRPTCAVEVMNVTEGDAREPFVLTWPAAA